MGAIRLTATLASRGPAAAVVLDDDQVAAVGEGPAPQNCPNRFIFSLRSVWRRINISFKMFMSTRTDKRRMIGLWVLTLVVVSTIGFLLTRLIGRGF